MTKPVKAIVGPKHFLDLADLDSATLKALVAEARARKDARTGMPRGAPDADAPLKGRVLALIFDKQSTRTRVSFDIGMRQLGGTTLMLSGSDMQLAREETTADTARVLSRYVDAVMIRLLDHEMVKDLAAHATVPVINGLTRHSHPCQIMADVMTFEEKRGPIRGATVAWLGDGNNVLTSWIHAAARFKFKLNVATPKDLAVHEDVREWAQGAGAQVRFASDDLEKARCRAARNASSPTPGVSMGDEDTTKRHNLLKAYQVNARMMGKADKDAQSSCTASSRIADRK